MRNPGLTYWQGGACGGALSGNGVSKGRVYGGEIRRKIRKEKNNNRQDERGANGCCGNLVSTEKKRGNRECILANIRCGGSMRVDN